MSSSSISAKHRKTNSFSDSLAISDLSFAPTPPPHNHTRQRSSISSVGSQSTSLPSLRSGSVIWNKSSSLPQLYYPGYPSRTSTPSEFSSNHISSEPPGLTSDLLDDSWSAASSSFQTSSSATLNNSATSQTPAYSFSSSSSRASFHRPLPDTPQASLFSTNTPVQTSATLPTIPGYGPIRLTVTMDLPQPPHLYQHTPQTSIRVDTPMSEIAPLQVTHSDVSLDTALDSFSAAELRQLLHLAVQRHPSFASNITSEYAHRSSLGAASKSVNFVQYSNSVWHTLNAKQHLHTDKSRQHALKAVQRIANDISSITAQIHRTSTLATKRNALEALRKIGRSICLATGEAGERVKNVLGSDKIFVDAMVKVASSFTENDRRTLWAGGSGAEIVKRLDQLDELRRCHGVFDEFDVVSRLLKKEDSLEGSVYC